MALLTAILLAVFVLPSPWGVAAVALGGLIEGVEAWFFVRWSQKRRAAVGAETLVGASAQVAKACMPTGQVRIQGELWQARCDAGAEVGDQVRVLRVEGLTLIVEPV